MKNFLNEIKARAIAANGSIVFPESGDERVLKAAMRLADEKIAKVILVGEPETVKAALGELNPQFEVSKLQILKPADHPSIGQFADFFYEKRKKKGVTPEIAAETVLNELFFGALLVQFGFADAMIAGAVNTTGDVLKSALQVIGVKAGLKTVSSTFIMVIPNYKGKTGFFSFADCAVVPDPTEEQLADIAISTAATHKAILNEEPKVALLSFSTHGSAKHEPVDKVLAAKDILKERKVDFVYDGELQLDSAIVPSVAASKAPGSPLKGEANVLIFPDLQSGNIGYKLTQRMAGAEAIGPLIQGLAKPVCDLSRGTSTEVIFNTAMLVLLMK
ncbi:MAG: phosphate acetyltransferase [Candidatus Cloacimonadaceae bacterium]|jgi:phosphate acetyltransferase